MNPFPSRNVRGLLDARVFAAAHRLGCRRIESMGVVWAKELARYGIRVGSIAPGFTHTEILSSMRPEVLDKFTAPVPLKRLGQPEEIAHAVLFILENNFFTGRCLEIDEGLRL
jgi:3-oxoacyl-[acyl-carrier protein] reductase